MTLLLRYMTPNDIPQIVNIDRWSFSTPWSARTYAYEISESEYSHMVVLEDVSTASPPRGLRRLLQSLTTPVVPQNRIVSYGGLWRVMEEAHISTIASHPDFRGKGYGEIALAAMVRRALMLRAGYVVLEVRVTNMPAQQLYLKYGFSIHSTKQRYYRDNGEDAYEMRLPLTNDYRHDFERRYAALQARHGFVDEYTYFPVDAPRS
jgi:[ribosomal protein S18]-alanine N-acetyltransferase